MSRIRMGAFGVTLVLLSVPVSSAAMDAQGDTEVAPRFEVVRTGGTASFWDWPGADAGTPDPLTASESGGITGWVEADGQPATGAWDVSWVYKGTPGAAAGPVSGEARLVSDGGAWAGTWGGTMFADGFCSSGWYEGEGAYAGLSLYLKAVFKAGKATFTGLIHEAEY